MIARTRNIRRTHVRLLATSDLHMQMTGFDYVKDRQGAGGSLAKLSTLIRTARDEARALGAGCLLFDNGDTLQGSPVADLAARGGLGRKHPMVACMNHLGYDAVGLGNHDFDHGLEHLAACLAQHAMPVICSNLTSDALPMLRRSLLLDCPVTVAGAEARLRVGVLSSLPDKTALWNRHQLQHRASLDPPLPALRRAAVDLRAQGADLVVVLAHMGLALYDEGPNAQNRIAEVAAMKEVDAVIGGHTHLRFPGPDHRAVAAADCETGMVAGTPVVQPGASASDLGVIDLALVQDSSDRWRIDTAKVALRPALPDTPQDPAIKRIAASAHRKTRAFLAQPVTRLRQPMNSFFALAHPSPVPALLAAAKRRAIAQTVAGTALADLPLIAVASAPLTGGFDGPDNFLSMEGGEVHRQHVAGMNPYANHVWAVRTNGAQLADWLERSALIFNTLTGDDPDQLLIDPRVPGFRYDTIYGLTYQIDPRVPPRFDQGGRAVAGTSGRVRDIRWQGAPLHPGQEFLVATTDHRAGGGGVYQTFSDDDIVVQGNAPLQEVVMDYLRNGNCAEVRNAQPWAFPARMNLSAILLTAPEAARHLDDIRHLRPEPCGETADGFLRLRLHF